MDEVFNEGDVSRLCHLSSRTVHHWIQKGYLIAWKTKDGGYQIKRLDLVRALQNLRLCIPDELNCDDSAKVLIVDDEPGIRKMLRLNLLGRFPGIIIEESGEGFHAGWRAHDLIPDFLILDILMPGLDGFRLCHMLRQHKELASSKIIAISALRENETRTKILSLGADEFLPKPFSIDSLEEIMVRLLPEKMKRIAA